MKWTKIPGPVLRERSRHGNTIETSVHDVVDKRPGDLDLSHMYIWVAHYSGYSYVISCEASGPNKALGYTASCRPIDRQRDTSSQAMIAEFVSTFAEAEQACKAHARGRRDA